MRPIKLTLENFSCYEKSEINFDDFSSAIIVGRVDDTDLRSNGAGKSTIFKAIEYVLFNQSESNLEKIVRDDTDVCKVSIEFETNNEIYKVTRSRTRKGTSDLSLYKKNQDWQDISGRRSADTEKELSQLLKINYQAFRSTVHFMQNDFNGLATVTASKRKTILKDALNLGVYAKLEKSAKEKLSNLTKSFEKNETLINSITASQEHIDLLKTNSSKLDSEIVTIEQYIKTQQSQLNIINNEYVNKNSQLTELSSNYNNLTKQKSKIESDIQQLNKTIAEYSLKLQNVTAKGKLISAEVKDLKDKLDSSTPEDNIDTLINEKTEKLESIKNKIIHLNIENKNLQTLNNELNSPIPKANYCDICKQEISESHREDHGFKTKTKIDENNLKISSNKSAIQDLQANTLSEEIAALNNKKSNFNKINNQLILKRGELQSFKTLYSEVNDSLNKNKQKSVTLNQELSNIVIPEQSHSNELVSQISNIILLKNKIEVEINELVHGTLSSLRQKKTLATRDIESLTKDLEHKNKLQEENSANSLVLRAMLHVVQAFSSTGIPNIIVQNVLDDLQNEANLLLPKIHPGLQLKFVIQKDNEAQDDTLDIVYYINSRERDFDQLSGAQKLAVLFSLKLGLTFLLQKMTGFNMRLLLLDEIDQSLDHVGVNAYADIVKLFQDDFKILVITHNDRLKDKFNYSIVVDQDMNKISRAHGVQI